MIKKIRYIAVHLSNDFSGSPRVLADFCAAQHIQSQSLTLITSSSSGFLADDLGEMKAIWYPRGSYQSLNLLAFILAQIQIFVLVIAAVLRGRRSGERAVVINNTILCWGSLLASRFMTALTIAYIHELSTGPRLTRKVAEKLIHYTADEIIFASQFLCQQYSFESSRCTVLPNGLRSDFNPSGKLDFTSKFEHKNVLFVGSLNRYKGVGELLKIAAQLPEISFTAVFSCTDKELQYFVRNTKIPSNLCLRSRQPDIEQLYRDAFLVLNLSLPNVCVESFGLTILEGMSYGCPCVVPVEGGHHDYFDQGSDQACGLAVDARETSRVVEFIQQLASDLPRWRAQADRALAAVQSYSAVAYIERVNDYLQQLDNRYYHSHLSGDQR